MATKIWSAVTSILPEALHENHEPPRDAEEREENTTEEKIHRGLLRIEL